MAQGATADGDRNLGLSAIHLRKHQKNLKKKTSHSETTIYCHPPFVSLSSSTSYVS